VAFLFSEIDYCEIKMKTKQEILKAIRVCAKKLGRNPSLRDLGLMAGISTKAVNRQLGGLRKAFELAGLEAIGPGFSPPESVLLLDWARVARKLKKLPSVLEYQSAGRYSNKPFHTRYGHWSRVAEEFRKFAGSARLKSEWRDVLATIAATPAKEARAAGADARPRVRKGVVLRDRPVYGRPLHLPEMAHEPTNETGVLFVFGIMARRLGFVVHRLQTGFPDCIAMRETARGKWQRVRIEFEFESRNFLKHRHRHDRCDVIVCWTHNWKECPLEVIELSKVVRGM
jgi:hypothetical protein